MFICKLKLYYRRVFSDIERCLRYREGGKWSVVFLCKNFYVYLDIKRMKKVSYYYF